MQKIIHIDMDAFYVSVEIRDNPSLKDKPVAVGGSRVRRGVLSTCNYIARAYGLHSAMPTHQALQLCPDLVLLPGRMEVYKAVSQQLNQIFQQYTDIIEPLSLDEAYLDVTNSSHCNGSATLIAEQIRGDIFEQTGLTASAGVAPLKFLAKIASDLNKPNGLFVITPEQVSTFIDNLPLSKISGVGKVSQQKLAKLNLHTGADIKRLALAQAIEQFGKFGQILWQRCQGIDNRRVQVDRVRKSVGVERTFAHDLLAIDELTDILLTKLLPELNRRLLKHNLHQAIHKVGVKIKFNDFSQTTKKLTITKLDHQILKQLLVQALLRGHGKKVRLLGLQVGVKEQATDQQLSLSLLE